MNQLNPRPSSSVYTRPNRSSNTRPMFHRHPSSSESPKSKAKQTNTSHSPSSDKHDKKKKKKHNKMGDENATTTTNNYKFMFFNRKFKISELCPPPDVKELFSKFAAGADVMSPDQFCNFLIDHQHEKVSLGDAKRILHEFSLRRQRTMKDKDKKKENRTAGEHGLTLDDFFNFLFDAEFNGPIKREVHHDMTAPLSHYFIYTGHNSYLTGNQLSSDCSDVPIIRALEKGVKVIELDLWPTPSKEDVQVYHGRTLTAPVTLVKCLKSIKEHAFDKSPYPVVITFEDHLTTKLRVKVAELVTQIFGDILYYPKLDDPMTEFPSPEALKHRIIISTKPPVVGESNDKNSSEESEVSDSDREIESKHVHAAVDIKHVQSEAPEYAALITIHAGKPRGGLKQALEVGEKVRRLSLSEQRLEKAAEEHGADIVRFTQRNILRIYPKGSRVTSSNYKPHVGWMHGAQMVAFNMQGHDKLLELMHGMFRANGGCGYVKKPGFLMHRGPNNEVFDPKRTLIVTKTLKVKVYMGNGWHLDFNQTHFDKYSPPDFYTKVYIVGVPADCVKHKTEIIYDEWIPVWNVEFTYGMSVPELAILRIEVRDSDRSDKDDFGGQTCLPVSELKSGIRSVPLYDHKGEKYTSVRLLMRFQFESNIAPA